MFNSATIALVTNDDIGGRPLGTTTYFLKEALRRLWLSRRNSIAAIGMIATALAILGTFVLISENLSQAVERQTGSTKLVIYFEPDVSQDQIGRVGELLDGTQFLTKHSFVSSEQAAEVFSRTFPNLRGVVDDLEENPFPSSFEVDVPEDRIDTRAFFDKTGEIRAAEGVEELQYNWEWIASLRSLVRIVKLIGFIVGGLLAVAAAFMIANVIRLTMILYREEIGVMRLVGATESMVRIPFLIEGLVQGLLGGLLAVGILAGLYYGGMRSISPGDALLLNSLFLDFLPPATLTWIIAGGAAAGLFGSWIAVRDSRDEGFEGREA